MIPNRILLRLEIEAATENGPSPLLGQREISSAVL